MDRAVAPGKMFIPRRGWRLRIDSKLADCDDEGEIAKVNGKHIERDWECRASSGLRFVSGEISIGGWGFWRGKCQICFWVVLSEKGSCREYQNIFQCLPKFSNLAGQMPVVRISTETERRRSKSLWNGDFKMKGRYGCTIDLWVVGEKGCQGWRTKKGERMGNPSNWMCKTVRWIEMWMGLWGMVSWSSTWA